VTGFEDEFGRLRRAQALVTEQLALAQAASSDHEDTARRRAERDILTAAALALAGLLALTLALGHLGKRAGAALRRERLMAETLQRSLLPARLPEVPGTRLAARFLPSQVGAQVGGDWYDAIALPAGGLALVIGDVTGHDIHAAAAMGQLRNALRAWSLADPVPAAMLDQLNHLLFAFNVEQLATCIYLRVPAGRSADSDTSGTVRIALANAGHCPPLVISPNGHVHLVTGPSSPPVGAFRATSYQVREHDLEPGATVLLYTDGLVERRASGLDQGLYMLLRTAAGLAARGPVDPETLCDTLLARLLQEPAEDDIALLALQLPAAPEQPSASTVPQQATRPQSLQDLPQD
jgi:serine phosphatase RsbU (regulator of sigma subunit)